MDGFFKIKKIEDITPSGIDGHKYQLTYETNFGICEGNYPDVGSVYEGTVDISATGTLQAVWEMTNEQFMGASGDFAAAQIIPFIISSRSEEIKFVPIDTYTAPQDPSKLHHFPIGKEMPLKEEQKPVTFENIPEQMSFLGINIAETRDNINAIAKVILGEKLLDLPQERSLFDMYRIPKTTEEFGSRLASLAGLAVAINTNVIENYLSKKYETDVKSIIKLEELLKELSDLESSKEICNILRQLNKLRQGYPIHGDNVKGVIVAHDYFEIEYPILNFPKEWEKIVNKYFGAMKKILSIFKKKRKNMN